MSCGRRVSSSVAVCCGVMCEVSELSVASRLRPRLSTVSVCHVHSPVIFLVLRCRRCVGVYVHAYSRSSWRVAARKDGRDACCERRVRVVRVRVARMVWRLARPVRPTASDCLLHSHNTRTTHLSFGISLLSGEC